MRVLMIHGDRREPGQGGGAESLLRDQAEGLKALGHEVAWWYGNGSLDKVVSEWKPDILHFMTIHCYPMGMQPLIWAQEQRIPHLMHVQDYWPFCGPRMLLVNEDVGCSAVKGVCDNECRGKRTDYVEICNRSPIVAGNAYTADIYRRNGLRCDFVCELGVDTERFRPDHSQRTEQPSIYTSTAWPEHKVKGMHIVQAAIKDTDYHVHLMAHTTRDNIAKGLKQAHVFLFPSCYEETFGLCLCEAMASGCACIASAVAGARAQIMDGVTGLLVPPRDPKALRWAIDWLMRDEKLRSTLGRNAAEHVAADHTLLMMGRRFEAAYQEVLKWQTVTPCGAASGSNSTTAATQHTASA